MVDCPSGVRMSYARLQRRISYYPSLSQPTGFYYYGQSSESFAASLANRHLPVTLPEYDSRLFVRQRFLRQFKTKCRPWTYDEYINSIDDTTKRNFYRKVYAGMQQGQPIRAYISPFTKLEKVSTTGYKPPRLIQGRHPTFNLAYGRYIKCLERRLKHRIQFGKGTYDQIGAKVEKLRRRWKYYMECDHTSFDAHVTVDMLRLIHQFYLSCFSDDRELRELSRRTINNNAYSRNGETYKIRGTRMSGDVDTSLGNSLLNYYILRSALDDLGIESEVIVNGDDSIIFTNVPLDPATLTAQLRRYNMDSRPGVLTQNIHKIEFCRTRLVYHPNGHPTMMFDYKRLRSIYGMTYKHYTMKQYMEYLKLIQHCNFMINNNSPIRFEWTPNLHTQLIIDDRQLKRVFDKQLSNKLWETNVITPSVLEAYPDFKLGHKVPLYNNRLKNYKSKNIIINHSIKELTIL